MIIFLMYTFVMLTKERALEGNVKECRGYLGVLGSSLAELQWKDNCERVKNEE